MDGQPGIDGSKGVKVKTLSVVPVSLNEKKILLIDCLLYLGGARRRWKRGLSWKTWAAG